MTLDAAMDELTNDILAALAKAGRLDLDLCAHILSMALWKQSGRPTTVRRATNSGGLKAVRPATGSGAGRGPHENGPKRELRAIRRRRTSGLRLDDPILGLRG